MANQLKRWIAGPQLLVERERSWHRAASTVAVVGTVLGVFASFLAVLVIVFPGTLAVFGSMPDGDMLQTMFTLAVVAAVVDVIALNGFVWRWSISRAALKPGSRSKRLLITLLVLVVGSPVASAAIAVILFVGSVPILVAMVFGAVAAAVALAVRRMRRGALRRS